MTGLLICAAVVAALGFICAMMSGVFSINRDDLPARMTSTALGLALIAAALYLAWRAGGAV